jgi:hypothetical protein
MDEAAGVARARAGDSEAFRLLVERHSRAPGRGRAPARRARPSHESREVREQAMFWLGQSGDARALAFFEEVLRR